MPAAYPRAVQQFGLAAQPDRAPNPTRRWRPRKRYRIFLWLPLTPLLWLLAPFVLLLAPVAWAATPPRYRINPYVAAFALGRVLVSLSGTAIEVDSPAARVSLRIF
jgi:hypothetical protein